ncbi:MAG: hypothetical protein ACLRVU_05315 [Beduini sp.]|uniref:hypothetical protein n=1 Tax=Beduini sp. TaxID=1922300 RepID=UPI00399FEBDC
MFSWLLYEFLSSLIIMGLFIGLFSRFTTTWIMALGMIFFAVFFVWVKRKKIESKIQKYFSYYIMYTIMVLMLCLLISKGANSHQI